MRPDGTVYDPARRAVGVKPSPVDFRGFDVSSAERVQRAHPERGARRAAISEHDDSPPDSSDPGGDAQLVDEYDSEWGEKSTLRTRLDTFNDNVRNVCA